MVPSAEEWAVHDYEDFPQMGEYPSLADIAAYVDLVDAHTNFDEDEVKAVVNNCNGDLATASEMLSDKHCGSYNCFRDYSDEAADEMMSFHEGVPECISNYFDYESWERDLKMDMTVIDTPYGVMVFHA
jgi:antirestriction protein